MCLSLSGTHTEAALLYASSEIPTIRTKQFAVPGLSQDLPFGNREV